TDRTPFNNLYRHGFARVAVAVPRCRVADPGSSAAETEALLHEAARQGAVLVAFPELGLPAYTCDDLFHQKSLLDACERALGTVVDGSRGCAAMGRVGRPRRVAHLLFNCAAVVHDGRVLGVVPKTYLPNYGEFYEGRQFNPADHATSTEVTLLGDGVPFGAALALEADSLPGFVFHVEICEDVWVPIPPSSYAALAGATVLVNLSAPNIRIGKSAYRQQLAGLPSAG